MAGLAPLILHAIEISIGRSSSEFTGQLKPSFVMARVIPALRVGRIKRADNSRLLDSAATIAGH
jgi:hypothetical protein